LAGGVLRGGDLSCRHLILTAGLRPMTVTHGITLSKLRDFPPARSLRTRCASERGVDKKKMQHKLRHFATNRTAGTISSCRRTPSWVDVPFGDRPHPAIYRA
jgi:hypothetical protein